MMRLRRTGLAESGIMPPMKYWELIANKLNSNGLVVGLSQRGSAAWLALEADARAHFRLRKPSFYQSRRVR
jgi:hypothetical protein